MGDQDIHLCDLLHYMEQLRNCIGDSMFQEFESNQSQYAQAHFHLSRIAGTIKFIDTEA